MDMKASPHYYSNIPAPKGMENIPEYAWEKNSHNEAWHENWENQTVEWIKSWAVVLPMLVRRHHVAANAHPLAAPYSILVLNVHPYLMSVRIYSKDYLEWYKVVRIKKIYISKAA
jgi:hypothetical protein